VQWDLDRLLGVFNQMESEGFDTHNFLKWVFFFVANAEEKLNELGMKLAEGYTIEYLEENDEESWQLHVTTVKILSPEKLHQKNIEFSELAKMLDIEYDGWDVERLAQG